MATKIFLILFSLTIISIKLASANSVKEQIGLNDPQKSVTINGNTLYYKHPYTTKETCINKTPTTPDKITQHLNIAYQGQLMYHNRSCPDKAACGFSCGIPYHAAVGDAVWGLFHHGQYKQSCLPDKHFIRNEAACINKCVKVERGNKKIIVPITDVTIDMKVNEVDLSYYAFFDKMGCSMKESCKATITYVECP
uniref:Uncharacterized protein n=1 Tax=Meloidogyne enterolobii TaxID=390850 RepID=A0A6V7X2P4_MELEN|nr:unnamed protein product [Meloidogyne enterolobii]